MVRMTKDVTGIKPPEGEEKENRFYREKPDEVVVLMPGQDMTLPEETTSNLATIKKSIEWLNGIEAEYSELPDVETKEGMALAKSRRRELTSMGADSNKARLASTKPLRDLTTKINDTWAEVFSPRIEKLKTSYDTAIKAVEQRKEAERERLKRAEQERVDGLKARLQEIHATAAGLQTIDGINAYLATLDDIDVTTFEEFQMTAESSIHGVKTGLAVRLAALQAQAEEAERLALQKAEQDRIAAEQAAETARIAAEQAAVARQQADAQARIEAQQKEIAKEKAMEERRKHDVEKSRLAKIQTRLTVIKDMPLLARSLHEAGYTKKELIELRSTLPSFDEHASTASDLIDTALATVETNLQRFREEADEAEVQRLADIEAAKAQAIQDEKDRQAAEQQKAIERQAEIDRLEAMGPDKVKLLKWANQLPAIPEMNSPDGELMAKQLASRIQTMIVVIRTMGREDAEDE